MIQSRKVPFFDYPKLFIYEREEILRTIEDVGRRGAFIMQSDLIEFEARLSAFVGTNHAVGVGNATDGLELAWMALGLKNGDEVIISSHTMLATASAIKSCGGVPVPVEIGSDNLLDPEAVAAAVTPRTVGISPTQLNGRTCDMDAIMKIASKNHLVVVEDSAQALGSKFNGKHAGTFGIAGVFSFFPAKVLGCLGDGGAVVTHDSNLYEKLFQLHDHGRDPKGEVRSWGRNSRLDNLQAALLNYRFSQYEKVVSRRRAIASLYQLQLGEIEELELPPAPVENSQHFDVYQNYELQADDRDDLRKFLLQRGIGTLIQWGGKGVHQWDGLGFNCKLPKVERFFERCLMLPMNVFLSDDDVLYISEAIRYFYKNRKKT